MYPVTYHQLELRSKPMIHTRTGKECHLTEIDLSLHVIEINSYLRKALTEFLCNLYHLIEVFRTRYIPILHSYILQILAHWLPWMDVI